MTLLLFEFSILLLDRKIMNLSNWDCPSSKCVSTVEIVKVGLF